ncbi:MAG TPA: ABC transporter permease [Candidatus Saccharimonadales bacterium]|nr:ABC transporter permease [Candidatus Saccharimonadales bacterium]
MKFSDIVKRSARNLRHAKTRTLLTAAALAVGGFTLTITLAAATGARQYTSRLISSNFDPSSLTVARDSSLFNGNTGDNGPQPYDSSLTNLGGAFYVKQLTDADLAKLRAIPGVQSVSPSYQVMAQYITRPMPNNDKKYTGAVADFETTARPNAAAGAIPDSIQPGQALLPEQYVNLLGFSSDGAAVGQQIIVQMVQNNGKILDKLFTVTAVTTKPATSLGASSDNILVAQNDAQALDDFVKGDTIQAHKYLTVTAKVSNGTNKQTLDNVKNLIQKAGYAAESVEDTQKFLDQIINILQAIILVFGAITLIASFFGVVNTQYISVLERTREIGLMKALGMSRKTVSRLFIVEATWIGFLGALLGSVLAIVAGMALNPWVSKKLHFGSDRLLVFEPGQIILLIIFLMLVTTVAGLLPARKAAKLDPIEALRTE